jgi:hypothetical protein
MRLFVFSDSGIFQKHPRFRAHVSCASRPVAAFCRTVWRWHFHVGLCVMPFILVLSLTGAVFLFKPSLDRWQERRFQNLPQIGPVMPSVQRDAGLAAWHKAIFRRHC